MSVRHLFLVGVALIMGCAGGTPGTGTGGALPRRSNVISADEIGSFNPEGKTAFDLVSSLRPKWLIARGAQSLLPENNVDSTEYAMVFVDGNPTGKLSSLRDVPAEYVEDIRFYDVAESGAKFGTRGGMAGVIEVRRKDRTTH
ncbi:MAG: hypothetical protein ABR585_10965 [Gemmatimonadaceae bacterium]